MSAGRALTSILLLLVAVTIQTTVLARLPLPLGRPELMIVMVACLAAVQGPLSGVLLGFAGGLLVDLLGNATLGRVALVLAVVGYVCGLAHPEISRGPVVPFGVVLSATVVGLSLLIGLDALLGRPPDSWSDAAARIGLTVVYDLALTPFVFPAVRTLIARLEPVRRP